MTISLGLDIGSNSVGSAWVDTDKETIHLGVSIFPAGVDEQENKRGSPKNQDRRQKRSQRRLIHRRAERKRRLRRYLMDHGLLPDNADALRKLFDTDPWPLRRKALREALSPREFGRVVVHLAQRRGAVGVETNPEDPDEGKVRKGMDRLAALMKEKGTETVGELLANLIEERRQSSGGVTWNEPIRNRQYRMDEKHMLFAGRELLRDEFHLIVEKQRAFKDSLLARILTDALITELDDPSKTDTWRHRGLLFGQRRTYWDTGTLGRCDLEPTERCAPVADRHAGYFRVIETVNNIRITKRDEPERSLTDEERDKVIGVLQLINALDEEGNRIPFDQKFESSVRSLASQAAVAINNAQLIADIEHLFKALVVYTVKAIDARSPHTAGHSSRVAKLSRRIAQDINLQTKGPFADVHFSDINWRKSGWRVCCTTWARSECPRRCWRKRTSWTGPSSPWW